MKKLRTIATIAEEINEAAVDYRMHGFQDIRKNIQGLSRRPTWKIFMSKSIKENEGWAFHWGGRTEIQFNIGLEGELHEFIRYGLAFSLERSQTLQDYELEAGLSFPRKGLFLA